MAEALIQVLIEKLTSLIQREVGLIIGADKQMKQLSTTLTAIQKVLEDAEDKQFQDRAVRNWLRQLNDVAFEIEDIPDELNTEANHKYGMFSLNKLLFNYNIRKRMKEAVQRLGNVVEDGVKFHLQDKYGIFSLNKLLFNYNIGERMKEDVQRLENVLEDHLQEIAVQEYEPIEWGRVEPEPDEVHGRDEDRDKIVELLVNQVCDQKLSVLAITGVGGIGKTTLAKLIYNDERINHHFDAQRWLCVSGHHDLIALSLHHRLRQELKDKRYLLVLDNVWNENQQQWAELKSMLECGSMGTSIVVTTRLKGVADVMGTLPNHRLTGLSDDHCWLLFRPRAFGHEDVQHRGNLEAIGRRIMKKCDGVPLAAEVLGGPMRFKRHENEWLSVEDSGFWNLPEEENSVLPVLRLSYRHLPFVLKRCLAYCAVFPKDYIFEKKQLIFHWMAHGCISSNQTHEVEDVGDQIWNELALRSFFRQVDSSGRETTFRMHDLVHDLAHTILKNRIPRDETESNNTPSSNSRIRQVHYRTNSDKIASSSIAEQLHTLTNIMSYDRLRILKINWDGLQELPSEIGKLKHLRCLNLKGCTWIRTLPTTLCCLYNLQVLILDDCSALESLPEDITHMTNLRHVLLEGCHSLSDMPCSIGELTSLKTLSLFVVGDKKGNQLDQLEHLNLGGRLEIKHLERVQDHMCAKKANLVGKPNLFDLVLHWEGSSSPSSNSTKTMDDEKVLEALEPHLNVTSLEINGFEGVQFPLWIKSLKNVTRIVIKECRNCRHLPPLGDLPLLKSLELWFLDALEYIDVEESANSVKFPSLEVLELYHLPSLKGLLKEVEVGEVFPNLKKVRCRNMIPPPFPFQLPNVSSLELDFGRINNRETAWYNLREDALKGLCNLKRLTVHCAWNHRFPVKWYEGVCSSLKVLDLYNCKIGSCFGEGWLQHFTSLKGLTVHGCSEVSDVAEEMKHLRFLNYLNLYYIGEMVSVPQGLQHVHSLQSLTLHRLLHLSSLPDWLADLRSLKWLDIDSCPAIPSLPATVFTNLRQLRIVGCWQLTSRCSKGNGEDWHVIARIPHLYVRDY